MKTSALLALLLAALSLPAVAQDGWHDRQGNTYPDSATKKSKDGFGAMLIITPDRDWQQKWETPPETTPEFSEADEVSDGGELFILTFLGNPKVGADGMTDVVCDFFVYRPDGSKSASEVDAPCFQAKLGQAGTGLYLTSAWLKFVAEPSDPRGTWRVEVVVKDRLRSVELPLSASFVLR